MHQAIQIAITKHQAGHLEEAEALYLQVLHSDPENFEAQHLLGVLRHQQGKNAEALQLIGAALRMAPQAPVLLSNYGSVLLALKQPEAALSSFDKALAIKPDYAEALNNRGNTLRAMKRFDEALASYDQAIIVKPAYAEALHNRGLVLHDLERYGEALASYDQALMIQPRSVEALNNRGLVLIELKRFADALASYDEALALKPDHAEALNNRGNALAALRRWSEALEAYGKALAIEPNYAEALHNRGNIFQALNQHEQAMSSYREALSQNPDHPHALSGLASSALYSCEWTSIGTISEQLHTHVAKRRSIIDPFTFLAYCDDPSLLQKCARNWNLHEVPSLPAPLWHGEVWRNHRIRIGYLSADFREHATSFLTEELFNLHDRNRFEILGVSYGPDDGSSLRARVIKSFDQFYDVRSKSDHEVAILLRDLQVDIVVDLMGYTENSRPGILAFRPAPIQINYLGFPGTMGAEFMDYVIADKIVAPFDQQEFCTERIVHLPDCFQVNNSKRQIAPAPTREQCGLPEHGFVFCCFNNHYKITPQVFDIWMRFLRAVEKSVLWLIRGNTASEKNLRKEAAKRGVDPARIIFAPKIKHEEHLARHPVADLFLDTLPINAGTTASDALWAGLPLVTCTGRSVASRLGSSLLHAIGLPELATSSLEAYEALALKLATEPALLHSMRQKLEENRTSHPLFDTMRFCRHLETAYITMWESWQRGESPRSFRVEPRS
jgi:protein O-GlcNAc transferase